MTVIEKYVCDFCGKEFDDDEECAAHEIQEQFDSTYQSIIFFDRHFNKIPVKNILEGYACDAFQISEEEEIPMVKKVFEESGICNPWEDEGGKTPEKNWALCLGLRARSMVSPAEVIEKMNEIFKQYGVDA